MYVSENGDNTILNEFMKYRKYNRRCSVFSPNLNLKTIDLYAAVSSLAVSFAQFLIGSSKHNLLRRLFLSFFERHLRLLYSSSNESDDSDEEESDKLGSESGSTGMYGTQLLCGIGINLGVTLYYDESWDSDGGSCTLPYKNIGEADTRECTGDANIFSMAQILAESWIDTVFVELFGMG